MDKFKQAVIDAVKAERMRVLYGGASPHAKTWIDAAAYIARARYRNGELLPDFWHYIERRILQ